MISGCGLQESLNLQPGANKVKFSITTKFQGTAKADCTVYLWHYTDKIVVSDVDGTITRWASHDIT